MVEQDGSQGWEEMEKIFSICCLREDSLTDTEGVLVTRLDECTLVRWGLGRRFEFRTDQLQEHRKRIIALADVLLSPEVFSGNGASLYDLCRRHSEDLSGADKAIKMLMLCAAAGLRVFCKQREGAVDQPPVLCFRMESLTRRSL